MVANADTGYRSLTAAGLGADAATRIALGALEARADLVVHLLAPGRISVARTRRPRWALVACVATVWLAGLGLLFLLVRRTDAGEVTVHDGPRGCVVTVPPLLDGAAAAALQAALLGGSLPSPSGPAAPVAPAAPAASEPPAAVGDDLEGRTVARSALAAEVPVSSVTLRFAAGTVSVAAGQAVVLGRDPASSDRADGRTVPGDGTTVSKSHLLVGFDGDVVTIEDLGSTNGSTVVRDGAAEAVVAGAPVAVLPGDQVALGALTFVVERREAPR
jgi:hypothetical protein